MEGEVPVRVKTPVGLSVADTLALLVKQWEIVQYPGLLMNF